MTARTAPRDSSRHYGLSRLLRDTIDTHEDSVGNVLHQMLQAARIHLGMDIAFISEFRDGRRVFRHVDHSDGRELIKVGDSDPLDETYCKRVVDGRLPELIHDAQKNKEACELPVTNELGIGAHLSTPIRLNDGSTFGTFCSFSFHAEESLNDRDKAMMRVFADTAGKLIQRQVDRAREEEDTQQHVQALFDEDRMHMLWQPIMDLGSRRCLGAEALARFPGEPYSGPPGWFNAATRVGMGSRLEALAMEKGLAILDDLPDECYTACNASANALINGRGSDWLANFDRLDRVVLEITEHDVIDDYAGLIKVLAPLRDRGLRLAVDDAGAGYASFTHILRLRPDIIKLDMSLTRDIDSDISRRALATALVNFAQQIGSRLVAEGVETKTEFETLCDLGVDMIQGYYLHRPKPRDEVARILAGNHD